MNKDLQTLENFIRQRARKDLAAVMAEAAKTALATFQPADAISITIGNKAFAGLHEVMELIRAASFEAQAGLREDAIVRTFVEEVQLCPILKRVQ